jgi:nucleoside-diphosphate-sugar epimerase
MSIAITGAAGQLGRLVIDDLLSADIPGTDLIAIARPRPEIGHLDETDRCGHRMRRVYCRSTTRCERTQMLRSYTPVFKADRSQSVGVAWVTTLIAVRAGRFA